VFPVRYELNVCILLGRNSAFNIGRATLNAEFLALNVVSFTTLPLLSLSLFFQHFKG
jgi:hypothetical protein